ncbi:MAG TPA: tRNA (guanosine(37)-N1)-methyltransferase TrmD [Dokdonella sp.]|uniref:tRNA (guanosine(37)-N1)-methyltransferase TrmD n=2 Tax=Dokdonella sp. TaxID=2291710 RepID=UPI002C75D271|nr:tRNA (guanosine(37)-N1)-methyltransferase TrmD [Dokdonella sp.]HOX71593.1 tRNA (guanosine(37)-N1)-methyltransferase TrmD [Dokdonella sp.]HPG94087.1 tRNA (guanosine(37)-N1)-methyltransferase TrmD [Dokdonella sp.]HPN79560.1 tRNA (guanosine(37)-N1)-methyltransferase TrmD [Dokdonella sp.]
MRIDVITLFPEFIESCAGIGVVGRAQERGLLEVVTCNPRDFATDNHRTVDGRPFGGGPGMLMTIAPLRDALDRVRQASTEPARVIYLSPQGARLTQEKVVELARMDRVILLCGRYEGVDERVLENLVDEELSIGDYVLSGGELAAAIVIDAIGRLQDGALNDAQSAEQDSFAGGLLDCPHYTRPVSDDLGEVPEVLLSGDHAMIRRWRRKQALGRTWLRRPDLLTRVELDAESRTLLDEFRRDYRAAEN